MNKLIIHTAIIARILITIAVAFTGGAIAQSSVIETVGQVFADVTFKGNVQDMPAACARRPENVDKIFPMA